MRGDTPSCSPKFAVAKWIFQRVSVSQFITALEQREGDGGEHCQVGERDGQTPCGVDIGHAEKAVAKAVDHVEKWVELRHPLPERGQRGVRKEPPGQKRERHDEE